MAALHVDLRSDWLQASAQRKTICQNLLTLIPAVAPDTAVMFIDWHGEIGNRSVFGSSGFSTMRFTMMLYGDNSIIGANLYSHDQPVPTTEDVSGGFRGGRFHGRLRGYDAVYEEFFAPEQLIFVRRQGVEVELVEQISTADQLIINWETGNVEQLTSLRTNRARILAPSTVATPVQRWCLE
jgi:hypothetical protein